MYWVRLPKHDPQKIKEVLHRNNIFVSIRGDAIRVAPMYTTMPKNLAKLVKALCFDNEWEKTEVSIVGGIFLCLFGAICFSTKDILVNWPIGTPM